MSRKIGSSRSSSSESVAPFTIDPVPSRLLAGWHVAVHAVAATSFLIAGLAWPVKIVGIAGVLAHSVLRRPPRATPLRRGGDGTWSLPARGLDRLLLRPGTAVGPFWIRLRLGAAG